MVVSYRQFLIVAYPTSSPGPNVHQLNRQLHYIPLILPLFHDNPLNSPMNMFQSCI